MTENRVLRRKFGPKRKLAAGRRGLYNEEHMAEDRDQWQVL
jgi:hypothetical protein